MENFDIEIAKVWAIRKQTLGLKGKTADKMALEFAQGANAALMAANPERAKQFSQHVFLTAVRGSSWLDELALVVRTPKEA